MRDSKGTTLDVFNLLFHSVHYWLELGVSIQQHQGFSRHRNEAAQALQRQFHWQDDGISMMLSKQSESTKVGLSADDKRARENNGGAAERPATLSNQRGSFQTFSESGHLNLL